MAMSNEIKQKLTNREITVANLLACGRSPTEIAVALNLKMPYTYTLIGRLRLKFYCETTTALIIKLAAQGYGQETDSGQEN